MIKRACTLTPGQTITPESLPPYILHGMASQEREGPSDAGSLAEMDRQYMLEVIEQEQGNISRAARVLGIHRATLYRKLLALGIQPDNLRQGKLD